ncbi:PTS ascorbate transporter subunit IIC, partial [Corynebacterium striatum]
WFGLLLGWSSKAGGALGLVLIAVLGLAVLALGWFSQRKLVATNWDPTPWREQPGAAAPKGEASDVKPLAAGQTAASKKYPKVLPPKGAPVPPKTIA